MLSTIPKLVINLPERTERMERFAKEVKPWTFNVINGVRKEPNWHGIAEAHMNAIKHAKEHGWDKVLIMEDDLYIPAKGKNILKHYLDEAFADKKIPEDWDILLGGVYHAKTLTKHNNYWNRIGEFCALHFYIVNARCYDKLLTWDKTNHYDRWVGMLGLKCYVPTRFFAIQYDGFSDNVNKITDYNSNYLANFTILK
jgi:GR25 family glycosyltransferase involved in LPS biosynthesis